MSIGQFMPRIPFSEYKAKGYPWTVRNAAQNNSWSSVTYGNGKFVAVSSDGTNRVMYSYDGITWHSVNVGNLVLTYVIYANGKFVAMGGSGLSKGYTITSSDGINWGAPIQNLASGAVRGIAYGSGVFVAAFVSSAGDSDIQVSADAETWNKYNIENIGYFTAIIYAKGSFYLCSDNGHILKSTNGITWGSKATIASGIKSIAHGPKGFVCVFRGSYLYIYHSTDGVSWQRYSAARSSREFVTYSNGLYVSVGLSTQTTGAVTISTDGVTWTRQTSPQSITWSSVVFGKDKFVAVASVGSNLVMTAP